MKKNIVLTLFLLILLTTVISRAPPRKEGDGVYFIHCRYSCGEQIADFKLKHPKERITAIASEDTVLLGTMGYYVITEKNEQSNSASAN